MENIDFFSLKTDLADENDEILRAKMQNIFGVETRKLVTDGVEYEAAAL